MVIRELKDGRSYVSSQEDHAELAAQFAAHWGNTRFSKLRPYDTMMFATTFTTAATANSKATRR